MSPDLGPDPILNPLLSWLLGLANIGLLLPAPGTGEEDTITSGGTRGLVTSGPGLEAEGNTWLLSLENGATLAEGGMNNLGG